MAKLPRQSVEKQKAEKISVLHKSAVNMPQSGISAPPGRQASGFE